MLVSSKLLAELVRQALNCAGGLWSVSIGDCGDNQYLRCPQDKLMINGHSAAETSESMEHSHRICNSLKDHVASSKPQPSLCCRRVSLGCEAWLHRPKPVPVPHIWVHSSGVHQARQLVLCLAVLLSFGFSW